MPYPCQKPRLIKKQPNLTGLRLIAGKFISFGPRHALETAAATAAAAAGCSEFPLWVLSVSSLGEFPLSVPSVSSLQNQQNKRDLKIGPPILDLGTHLPVLKKHYRGPFNVNVV